jgi:hypothetical protein
VEPEILQTRAHIRRLQPFHPGEDDAGFAPGLNRPLSVAQIGRAWEAEDVAGLGVTGDHHCKHGRIVLCARRQAIQILPRCNDNVAPCFESARHPLKDALYFEQGMVTQRQEVGQPLLRLPAFGVRFIGALDSDLFGTPGEIALSIRGKVLGLCPGALRFGEIALSFGLQQRPAGAPCLVSG